jgi:hypothetical protein
LKVAILGTNRMGGGYERTLAYNKYLQSKNYDVKLIQLPETTILSRGWFFYQNLYGRLQNNITRLMEKIGDKYKNVLKKEKFDVVIGVETYYSYVFTKDLDCLKLFSFESPAAIEMYFSKKYDMEQICRLKEMELKILMNSDYVIFPWKTSENYVKKYIWNGHNFRTIQYGCYPKDKKVSYYYPMSLVYLGTLRPYWANKELLSYLTKICPYVIDVFGNYKQEKQYFINHKGFARTLDVLYSYQFGLNTISKDPFRKNHFSSKIINYLAYGLPVLFPDWQNFPKDLRGCIPYNEDDFLEVIEKYSEKEQWEKLSKKAGTQGRELDWEITLKPLEKLIEK